MMGIIARWAMGSVVVAAAGLVARSAVDVIDVSAIRASEPPRPGLNSPVVDVVAVAPLESLGETRERPIFAPNRRPSLAGQSVPEAEPAPGLTLIGLMRSAGQDARALIRRDGREKADWVAVGGSVDGATVLREVRAGVVVLERDGRVMELRLRQTRTAAEETP